ncbi:SPASM domain peptide maturase of grasp-with-spasm system [Hymenobacter sp. UYAg731]
MSPKPYFCLYAHNISVGGKARSAIYDLQRGQLVAIPNVLHRILLDMRQRPWRAVQQQYAPDDAALFGKYLAFLLERDLGLFVDDPLDFPPLSLQWQSPHAVLNAVVSYAFEQYDLAAVLTQLDALQCRHLELRLTTRAGCWPEVLRLADALVDKSFQSVTLLLTHSPALADPALADALYARCPKILSLVVHAAPSARASTVHPGKVAFITPDLRRVPPRPRYVVSLPYFAEAQRFNPYYNRKLCVDETGAIKNCLLLADSFGHVDETPLAEVLACEAFQVLWHVAPDRVAGVKDSELRYALFSADCLVEDPHSGLFVALPHPVLASYREPVEAG